MNKPLSIDIDSYNKILNFNLNKIHISKQLSKFRFIIIKKNQFITIIEKKK